MTKAETLYKIFCNERKEELADEINFRQRRSELENHLTSKLSKDDYLKAEEMINSLEVSAEEAGFKSGCNMLSELYSITADE